MLVFTLLKEFNGDYGVVVALLFVKEAVRDRNPLVAPFFMIIEHEGNIFLAPVDIIIHQCNCFHTMGSGIAKTISEMFPEVYKTDCEKTIKGDITKLGSYNFTKVSYHLNPQLKYIMNLYGQYKYGGDRRYTSYDALAEGFASINEGANKREKIPVLAVPYKLGSARAGGSWQVVRAILDDTFGDSKVPLYICKFEV